MSPHKMKFRHVICTSEFHSSLICHIPLIGVYHTQVCTGTNYKVWSNKNEKKTNMKIDQES